MKNTIAQLTLALLLTLTVACEKKEDKQSEESAKLEAAAPVQAAESTPAPAAPQGEQSKVVAEFPNGTKITSPITSLN
jgi:hypothetical protein